jgi:alanyl-tRNA synthetase
VVIVGTADGRASVVVAVDEQARGRGLSANELVRAAATALGGRGGGKDDVAQGGGTDLGSVDQALAEVRALVARTGQ